MKKSVSMATLSPRRCVGGCGLGYGQYPLCVYHLQGEESYFGEEGWLTGGVGFNPYQCEFSSLEVPND